MDVHIKQESVEFAERNQTPTIMNMMPVIDNIASTSNSSSSSESSDSDSWDEFDIDMIDESEIKKKRPPKIIQVLDLLPLGFLDPIRPQESMNPTVSIPKTTTVSVSASNFSTEKTVCTSSQPSPVFQSCKQFWKAGDYEGNNLQDSNSSLVGMDHVRVHPKFLHSNATSHKWALGAFAELLDNALDEVCSGATYVRIDMLMNKKDKTKMLVVEDNGGGMTPDKMRQCMSLGYSAKSKLANTIGQYGNGFKTSTMRLGADVIVFSRCRGNDVRSPSQTIGMLSYTFLRGTGKEDIVVPMIDYEKRGQDWIMMARSSPNDWSRNLKTVVSWSPYESEEELLQQFNSLKDQGTRIVIYNLWEDDEGNLELDFDTNQHDIQIRGVNRDEKKIAMAKNYPNSMHFLTYRHSLRSYASILYLRIPPGFRIILRGTDVVHHNLVNDMMLAQEIKYKPLAVAEGTIKDPNMGAVVTIGFVKDAKHHIDIQGFNVYHKNRLIKPFWRVWNAAGSDGRGVIGLLEANFVEPAHDKQGFERTTVLSRLEARLVVIQKNYWSANCHHIGYAKRRHAKDYVSPDRQSTPSNKDKPRSCTNSNGHVSSDGRSKVKSTKQTVKRKLPVEDIGEDEMRSEYHETPARKSHSKVLSTCDTLLQLAPNGRSDHIAPSSGLQEADIKGDGHANVNSDAMSIVKLKEEDCELTERRLEKMDGLVMADLSDELQYERDRIKSLESQLQEAHQKIEHMDKEQEALINIFSEERNRRDLDEENLRNRLKDASNTIQELLDKVKLLENRSLFSCKIER